MNPPKARLRSRRSIRQYSMNIVFGSKATGFSGARKLVHHGLGLRRRRRRQRSVMLFLPGGDDRGRGRCNIVPERKRRVTCDAYCVKSNVRCIVAWREQQGACKHEAHLNAWYSPKPQALLMSTVYTLSTCMRGRAAARAVAVPRIGRGFYTRDGGCFGGRQQQGCRAPAQHARKLIVTISQSFSQKNAVAAPPGLSCCCWRAAASFLHFMICQTPSVKQAALSTGIVYIA